MANELMIDSDDNITAQLDASSKNGENLARFFKYAHLPAPLRDVSRVFASLAVFVLQNVPRNPERTVALRKLVEAKDCAVRAVLPE